MPAPPPPETPAPARTTPPPPPPPVPRPADPPRPTLSPTEEEIFARMTVEEVNAQKPLDDVHFEYDASDLTDNGRAALQKNAAWLKRWSSTRISVEGHADSRGTSEYNLALGERRATVVRDYLVSLGIPAARLSVVSMGKEQPVCHDEAESCWSQNRRGHFVVTAK
jgi:peptidoglycan-associated lipoprotein